jgi:hypothetical protein
MVVTTCEVVSVTYPHGSEHTNSCEEDWQLCQDIGGREYGELDAAQDCYGDSRRDPDIPHHEDHPHREAIPSFGATRPTRGPPRSECQNSQQGRRRGNVGQGIGRLLRFLHIHKPQQCCEGGDAEAEQGTYRLVTSGPRRRMPRAVRTGKTSKWNRCPANTANGTGKSVDSPNWVRRTARASGVVSTAVGQDIAVSVTDSAMLARARYV